MKPGIARRNRAHRTISAFVAGAVTFSTFAGTVAFAGPASATTLEDLIESGVVQVIDESETDTEAEKTDNESIESDAATEDTSINESTSEAEPEEITPQTPIISTPISRLAENESVFHRTSFLGLAQIAGGSTLRGIAGVTMEGNEDFDFTFAGGNSSANNGAFLVTGGNRTLTTTLPDLGPDVSYRVEVVFASHDNTQARGIRLEGNSQSVELTGVGQTNWQTISDEYPGGTALTVRSFGAPVETGNPSGNVRIQSIRIIEIDNRSTAPQIVEELWHTTTMANVPVLTPGTTFRGVAGVNMVGDADFDLTFAGNANSGNPNSNAFITGGNNRRINGTLPAAEPGVSYRVEVDFASHGSDARGVTLEGNNNPRLDSTDTNDRLTLVDNFAGGADFSILSHANVRIHEIRIIRISETTEVAPAQPQNLAASTGVSGTIVLSWDAVRQADSYIVTVDGEKVATTAATSYVVEGLENGTEYTFSVAAQNANGVGEAATIVATPGVADSIELETGAWFETVFASFTAPVDAQIQVEVRQGDGAWEPVDQPLVRVVDASRGTWRVDVPGRLAGVGHELRIRQIVDGDIVAEGHSQALTPQAFDRQGGAFIGGTTTGGYNADGTVRENAQIIYVTPENANEVLSAAAFPSAGGNQGSRNATPTIIRVLGKIGDIDFVGDTSMIPPAARANYFWNLRFRENVTIEGIGPDAMLYGFGIQVFGSENVEIRNLSIDMYFDDAIGIHGNNRAAQGDSTHYWIHNNRIFYGQDRHTFLGEDEDLIFGDGGIDVTNHARNFTIDNNQLFGTYKAMLLGNARTDFIANGTVHHNWFVGAGSRLPRVRNAQVHVFNNVIEGATSYGIGAGHASSIVSEGNIFTNTNRPYIISGQGTAGLGTLSSDYPGAIMTSVNDNGFAGRQLVADKLDQATYNTVDWTYDIGLENSNPRGSHTFDGVAFPLANGVQSADVAEAAVRANAGPLGDFVPSQAPHAPVVNLVGINAEVRAGLDNEHVVVEEGTFLIRWQGDVIADSYTIQWDQGTGVWENVATVARSGRPLEFITTTQRATIGGTYNFRVVAANVSGSATSEEFSVSYVRPSAPTNLTVAPILGGLIFNFAEPAARGVSYEIRMYSYNSAGDINAGAEPIVLIADRVPFTAIGLDPGEYRVEVRTMVGSFFSEPLVGDATVDAWRIEYRDLVNQVWGEDFAGGWANGPVRGEDAQRLGLSIVTGTGGPGNNGQNINQNFPGGIVEGRNDVFIDDDGLRLQDVSAPIIDRNPETGAGSFVSSAATAMFVNIGDAITEGRVMIDLGLQYVRSTAGNSSRPIRVWDENGVLIIDRRVDELPPVPFGPEQQHASAAEAEAGIVTPASDLQHWQIILDLDTRRFDMFLNGSVFVFDQPFPAAATGGLKWVGAVTPTGNQSSHNWAELSNSYRFLSVLTTPDTTIPEIPVVVPPIGEVPPTTTFPEPPVLVLPPETVIPPLDVDTVNPPIGEVSPELIPPVDVTEDQPLVLAEVPATPDGEVAKFVTLRVTVIPEVAHTILGRLANLIRNTPVVEFWMTVPVVDGVAVITIDDIVAEATAQGIFISGETHVVTSAYVALDAAGTIPENAEPFFTQELVVYAPDAVDPEPATPEVPVIPAWDRNTVYNTGDRVLFEGRVFEAQWWVQGTSPADSGPWGSWMEIAVYLAPDGNLYDLWTADRVFTGGEVVFWEGALYQAQWWTRNQTPDTQWGPWEFLRTIS